MTARPDAQLLYNALLNAPGRLGSIRRLTYRCQQRRCLLLDALEVPGPDRVLIHQKRFKQSDTVNDAASTEEGRRKNTFDGDRHWMPRTYYIETSALAFPHDPGMRLGIQCDHVGVLTDGTPVSLRASAFQQHWQDGVTDVLVRRDGTALVVR